MIEPNFSILIVQVLTFFIAVFVLWKFLWKPLVTFMAERSSRIEKDLSDAKSQNEQAGRLAQEYNQKLDKVNEEAKKIFDGIMAEGRLNKEKILKETQEEAKRILKNARAEINTEKESARQQLRTEVASLSLLIAERVMKQTVDKKVQGKLVQEFIDGLKNG